MSRGDVTDSVMLAQAAPAMGEFDPKMLEMPKVHNAVYQGGSDFILTQNRVEAQSQNQQGVETPADKAMNEVMTSIQKELADRKAKNGSVGEADLKEVLPKYFPKMKEAISLADTQAAASRKIAADEYVRVKPDLQRFSTEFPKAMERFTNATEKVPDADGEKVDGLLTELTDAKTSAARKAEIRKDLAKYPDLADSTEALQKMTTEAEAKFGKLTQAVKDMTHGLADGLLHRGFYAQSLQQADGDPKEIERVAREAQAVQQLYIQAVKAPGTLYMPPEDLQPKKPLPPLQKA